MKKWLYPVIAGGLILALGATFSRSIYSHRAAVAAEQATANEAQVPAGNNLATEIADPQASGDAKSAVAPAESAAPDDAVPAAAENAAADVGTDQPHITLNYANAPWSVVLRSFADATKTELVVVDSMPFSRFTKSDLKPLSRADALEVLNQALEPENFRLLIKGSHLILYHLKAVAPDKEQPPKILIVPVQNRDAESLLDLVKKMHPKGETIYADPRTNSLIFPNGAEEKYLDILRELDQPETKKNNYGPVVGANSANSLTDLPIVGRLFASNQAPSGGPSGPAAREYQQFEAQCLALAAACREQQAAAPQDAKRFEQLKNELQGAVHSSFHARQSWQRAQAVQLRERLEQIERRISERSQLSHEIIQRRVDDLLNPAKQWESGGDVSGGDSTAAKAPNNSAEGSANANPKPGYPTSQEKNKAGGNRQSITGVNGLPEQATQSEFTSRRVPGATPGLRGDVRKDLLNAEAGVASAEAAILEAKAAYERSATSLKRVQALHANAAVPYKAVSEAEADSERSKGALTRAESELAIKQRMLQGAREMLALEIKLRESDLADAKARVDHAAAEMARFENMYKQNAISQDVYESRKLPQQLAASQYERAKMLLDLYRQALPERTSFTEKPNTQQSLAPKSIDFNVMPAADDSRQRVRDAAHAVTLARAAHKESQVSIANSEQSLKTLQAAETKFSGSVPKKTILDAEHDVRRDRAAADRLTVDLEVKERQLQEAREMLAGRIKLLEIDLADAKLRLEEAESKFSRASQLLKKGAIANEQYEETRVARGLAESQYQRAQLLLDHSKAIHGQDVTTEKSQSGSNQKQSDTPPQADDRSDDKPRE